MIDGRKRVATVLASLCIAALGGTVLVAAPSNAEPSISDVREKVDGLYHQAEEASERYNEAHEQFVRAKARLAAVQADLRREQAAFDEIRDQVAAAVVAQYQSQGLSTAGQVLLSDDPDTFLSQLQTVSAYNERQGAVLKQFTVRAKQLALRKEAAQRQIDEIAATEKALKAEQDTIEKKTAEAEALLDDLEAEAYDRLMAASRSGVRVDISNVPASGRAKAAVAYAMAQVGDAYSYGGVGPSAYDCSGLTMMAWAQAGVGLPHSSAAQRGYGVPVSESQLQPGDLVFYYSPISHVGIYIGNGMIVHAANPSQGVRVDPLHLMPYVGAVRPG
ncbi:MAG TPA: NlpC/P60 family protein [Nocardioidaceae bacterium]|nr:NlpC/P60 family protein [Nocardioidaceae bacterium]